MPLELVLLDSEGMIPKKLFGWENGNLRRYSQPLKLETSKL
jgi:hypothetical protein